MLLFGESVRCRDDLQKRQSVALQKWPFLQCGTLRARGHSSGVLRPRGHQGCNAVMSVVSDA